MATDHNLIANLDPAEHLLVVTPPNASGRYGLQLEFRSATVIEASNDGMVDVGLVRWPADRAVIEAPAHDINWAHRAINAVSRELPDEALIVVIFPHDLVAAGHGVAYGGESVPDGPPISRRVYSTGLVGDTVGVVLGPAPSSTADGMDAWQVLATTGHVIYLKTLARATVLGFPEGLATGEAPIVKQLRAEVHRLSTELESAVKVRDHAEQRYRALLHSRLGRVTSRYWRLRKSITGGPRR
jgi:hypothetical protein